MELRELDGPYFGGDHSQRAAGLDRLELPIITDESYVGTCVSRASVTNLSRLSVPAMPALSTEDDVAGSQSEAAGDWRSLASSAAVVEPLGKRGGLGAGGVLELRGGRRCDGQADDAPAVRLDRLYGELHSGGFAGVGRADADCEHSFPAGERAGQFDLAVVERYGLLCEDLVERGCGGGRDRLLSGGVEQRVLGVDHAVGRVDVAVPRLVDRGSVRTGELVEDGRLRAWGEVHARDVTRVLGDRFTLEVREQPSIVPGGPAVNLGA